MRRFLCALAVSLSLAISGTAFAGDILNVDGLSDSQKAELQLQAAKLKETNKETNKGDKTTVPTPQKVSEYVDIGTKIGAGLASTARELGVEVNNFASTPVGMLAIALIVTKLVGWTFFKVIFGSIFGIIGTCIWWYGVKRHVLWHSETITGEGKDKKSVITYAGGRTFDENSFGRWAVWFFALAFLLACTFFIIFG